MKRDDVVRHFGNVAQTARAFGISVSAVYQWGEVVPERIAYKAQILTGGVLQVDASAYPRKRSRAA